MRFTTLTFLIFFLFVYVVFWSLHGKKRLTFLIIASILFYAAWSITFVFHFIIIVLINYCLLAMLYKSGRAIILFSILSLNIANLFLFKYFYLFLRMLFDITEYANTFSIFVFRTQLFKENIFQSDFFNSWLELKTGADEIILPLAISFYSFQLIAYAVDVYRGKIPKKASLRKFLVFILFFPQLVAGPIMRHADFFHQLNEIRPDEKKTLAGMFLLMQGLIKKVIIADNILPVIRPIFASPELYDWQSNLIAAIGFSIRVYCDFSGYTDIARGLGNLLGLHLPENFVAPYLSSSFRELWQRWHITLSTWVRDYLYIPLGGSRQSELRIFFTLVLSFALSGLWHGAGYNYLLWGTLHGVLLAMERLMRKLWERKYPLFIKAFPEFKKIIKFKWITKFITVPTMFSIWVIAAIFFNAPGFSEALMMIKQIFSLTPLGIHSDKIEFIIFMLFITFIFNFIQLKKDWSTFGNRKFRYIAAGILLFLTIMLLGRFSPEGVDFIYFQF